MEIEKNVKLTKPFNVLLIMLITISLQLMTITQLSSWHGNYNSRINTRSKIQPGLSKSLSNHWVFTNQSARWLSRNYSPYNMINNVGALKLHSLNETNDVTDQTQNIEQLVIYQDILLHTIQNETSSRQTANKFTLWNRFNLWHTAGN